ncbi:hypothetical protein Q5530_36920 [Saccharothrix sp. BKS2]|uniref:hypothetical protein n=1 Tax=Saccharothrix sp. BKS2 TaxID=3064400 RepID=UPI0039E72EC3
MNRSRTPGRPRTALKWFLDHARSGADGEVVAEQVGPAIVVRPARYEEHLLREIAGALPAGPLSIVVAGGDAPAGAVLDRLARVVTEGARRGVREVRLVLLAGFPAVAPERWRALAERTRVTLLVPSGTVVPVGGTLFVRGPHGGLEGRWSRFAPGEPDHDSGPRHPAPRWQDTAAEDSFDVHGGLVVEHLPAGVLLRPAATASARGWHAVPPDPHRFTVIAGVSGGARVLAEDVIAYLSTLPLDVLKTARLACGDGQDVVVLGRAVARGLDTAVTAIDGLPVVRRGKVEFMLHDPAGRPTWTPYLQEIRCLTGETAAVPLRWRPPHTGLVAQGPGLFLVRDGWVVGVMRSGLWLRRAGGAAQPVPVGAPVDPSVVTIAVGDLGEPLPDEVWPVLCDLLDRLEAPVLRRVRLSVLGLPSGQGRAAVRELTRARGIGAPLPVTGDQDPAEQDPGVGTPVDGTPVDGTVAVGTPAVEAVAHHEG